VSARYVNEHNITVILNRYSGGICPEFDCLPDTCDWRIQGVSALFIAHLSSPSDLSP
jgi:hypothetical protein